MQYYDLFNQLIKKHGNSKQITWQLGMTGVSRYLGILTNHRVSPGGYCITTEGNRANLKLHHVVIPTTEIWSDSLIVSRV